MRMKSKIMWYITIINVGEVHDSNTDNTQQKSKIKGWPKLYNTNANEKAEVMMLMSDQVEFRTKSIKQVKKDVL